MSTFLVVDDDVSNLELFKIILENEGFEVVTSTNGLDGLQKAKALLPDFLLLDVMLPGIDGFEICHRLRREPATAKIPIIIHSAKGQSEDRDAAIASGANDFIKKPFERQDLLDRIRKYLV